MNSYTINVADYELKLRCGLSEEELKATAAKVDGLIRGICSKSNNVSKTEAAILCALEFCSMCNQVEQSAGQNDEELEQMAEELKKAATTIAKLEAKLDAQKAKADANAAALKERYEANSNAQKEKYEGRIENMKTKYESRIEQLKAKLDEAKNAAAAEAVAAQMSMDIPADETVEEKLTPPTEEQEPIQETIVVEEKPAEAADDDKARKSKSKVGSMFELLTFGDV